ncbi:hypothetical protein BBF96_14600 [Anoxybacter fermentans]|uniref:HTH cro/C1-type domain-containing protein n=1 Tax=Anoxybacter fermentans TaxID=1323375 RepID=A0A3S9T1W7_9FIRM|nr:helix-turn-helix transcriptional regulator [Anoxybacter fermentans]AZR74507.1 hypothetical protein BBF96_14600 [Anoxybacter fermentans]
MYDPKKLSKIIQKIQTDYDLTNDKLGEMLGVSGSYISQIKNLKRGVRPDTIKKISELFDIPIERFLPNSKEESSPISIGKTILKLRRMKNLTPDELSDKTGISILDLSQIEREKLIPTKEQLQLISKALGIDVDLIKNGDIIREFENVRSSLERLGFSKDAIEAVMRFMEREL